MSGYTEKLRDPRWQQKRLRIFERDEWECQYCFDRYRTLTVHHEKYIPGKPPWDIDDDLLITLCENCHTAVEEMKKDYLASLAQ